MDVKQFSHCLLLLCLLQCSFALVTEGTFHLATVENDSIHISKSLTYGQKISLTRPQSHTLLFKPAYSNGISAAQFFYNDKLIRNATLFDKDYYSITTGVFSAEECADDVTKCWIPSIEEGTEKRFKFRFEVDGGKHYESIYLELSYSSSDYCANVFKEKLAPTILGAYDVIAISSEEDSLRLNEIPFSFSLNKLSNQLGCEYSKLHFEMTDISDEDKAVVVLSENIEIGENEDFISFAKPFSKTGSFKFGASVSFKGEYERIACADKQLSIVLEDPPSEFTAHSTLNSEYNFEKDSHIIELPPICATVPKLGTNSSGLMNDLFSSQIYVVSEFGYKKFTNITDNPNEQTEHCSSITLDRDFIGKISVYFVYRNNLMLGRASQPLQTTIYADPIPVVLQHPKDIILTSLKEVIFYFETVSYCHFGYNKNNDELLASLLMNEESELKTSTDGKLLPPHTIVGQVLRTDFNHVAVVNLKKNSTYYWAIVTHNGNVSKMSEIARFTTTQFDCTNSDCKFGTCFIRASGNQDFMECNCDMAAGTYGEFCQNTLFTQTISEFFATYIPLYILMGLCLVFVTLLIVYLIRRRNAPNSFTQISDNDAENVIDLRNLDEQLPEEIAEQLQTQF